jgi:hypothetical protein
MLGVSLSEWQHTLQQMDVDAKMVHPGSHPGVHPGMRVLRAGNHNITSRDHAMSLHFKSWRVWLEVSDPQGLWKKSTAEVQACL